MVYGTQKSLDEYGQDESEVREDGKILLIDGIGRGRIRKHHEEVNGGSAGDHEVLFRTSKARRFKD